MTVVHEIKQRKPFPSKGQEAAVTLMRTADVVRRAVGSAIEPHGITVQQYNVLRILRGAGPDGLPTLEIVQRMIEQTPGITRLINRLQGKNLVARSTWAGKRALWSICMGSSSSKWTGESHVNFGFSSSMATK